MSDVKTVVMKLTQRQTRQLQCLEDKATEALRKSLAKGRDIRGMIIGQFHPNDAYAEISFFPSTTAKKLKKIVKEYIHGRR